MLFIYIYIANKTRSSKRHVVKSAFTRQTNHGHYSSTKVSCNIITISMSNYTITVIQYNNGRTVIIDNDEEASRFSIL